MGHHVVLKGETIYCIARAYGVLPAAIAQANGLFPPFNVDAGQTLAIPEVQWVNIATGPAGPVCKAQFTSKYPGLQAVTPTPAGPIPLSLSLSVTCIANCDVMTPDYVLHIEPTATGGKAPYSYTADNALHASGTGFDSMSFGHCTPKVEGWVKVTDADGQTVTTPWVYYDTVVCPTAIP